MKVVIPELVKTDIQYSNIGNHNWSVSRLFELTKDFLVMDIPLRHLNIYSVYNKLTLREMVMHCKAILNADLSYPIILDHDGDILDGRHRIMRALLEEKETIKAVRFDINHKPCKISD